MIQIIPKLKFFSAFDNEILYSQGDWADEIFFIYDGSAILYTDFSDEIDMEPYVHHLDCFNVPICIYSSGAYFGDNDVIPSKIGYRS